MVMQVSASEGTALAEKVAQLQRLRDDIRALDANGCGISPVLKERHDKLSVEVLTEAARDRTAKLDFPVFGPDGILAWAMAMKRVGAAAQIQGGKGNGDPSDRR